MDRNMGRPTQMMSPPGMSRRPPVSPRELNQISQHDELIRYIQEAWKKITSETGRNKPEYYNAGAPEARLVGFQPFDLEAWWGQRAFQKMNITHGHQ